MNRRAVGAEYERMALDHVRGRGASIVGTNFRCRTGEIDLIFWDGKYLVFAEVKYRSGARYGTAAEAVDVRKRRTICRAAAFYLNAHGYPSDTPVRFDVIAFDRAKESASARITWLKDAFSYDI